MDLKTVAILSVTIFVEIVRYLVTYFNNLRFAQRKDHLERIDRQLGGALRPTVRT